LRFVTVKPAENIAAMQMPWLRLRAYRPFDPTINFMLFFKF
jgi:hypothetical protein